MLVGSCPPMPCGVGDNTLILAKNLVALGNMVEIITSMKSIDDSSNPNLKISPVMSGWSSLKGGMLLKRIIETEPDVVHVQYPSKGYGKGFAPAIIGMQLRARRVQAPFIVTLHEFAHAHPLRKATIVPLLSEASAVIFPSVQERDALHKRFATLKKIPSHVIPIGAVLPENFESLKNSLADKRNELESKWKVPKDGIIVNYGFIQPHKGIETIFKALKILRSEGYSTEFWHIGKFDPHRISYHRFLEYISKENALNGGVKFLGFMPLQDIWEIFTVARVGVFPFTDGYSDRRSSMITFAHADVPIITTRSSIPEVDEKIAPYVSLINRNNHNELKNTLEEIVANNAIYDSERERVKGFKELYRWDNIARETEMVYRKYLK